MSELTRLKARIVELEHENKDLQATVSNQSRRISELMFGDKK
jgi:hypothetical protein